MLLSVITLTSPMMAAGLVFLVLPVIAHLLNRQASRQIIFPTIRFLRRAVAQQSSIFRFRHWILLAIRCVTLGLIVLAFMRPIWFQSETAANSVDSAHGVVILLDCSASTQHHLHGVPYFRSLQATARRLVDGLRPGRDVVNVIKVTGRPEATSVRLSPNLPLASADIGRTVPTQDRADFVQALTLATQQLQEHQGPRQIAIVSDLQATNWEPLLQGTLLSRAVSSDIAVTVITPPVVKAENLALSSPRLFPVLPVVGQPVQGAITVTNHSAVAKQTRIELKVESASVALQNPQSQTVALQAGEKREVSFLMPEISEGEHRATYSLPADDFEPDNQAFQTFTAAEPVPILLVSDDPPGDRSSGAWFLTRALAPGVEDQNRFAVRQIAHHQVTAETLRRTSAVIVDYLGTLPPAAGHELVNYLRQGGGILLFCGAGPVSQNLLALNEVANEDIIPWKPGVARISQFTKRPLHITGGRWQSPFLREFDLASQLAISQITFHRTWSTGAIAPTTQVLLTFSDGTPALGVRAVGKGQLVVANFSPGPGHSDVAKYGTFVALTQSVAQHLTTIDRDAVSYAPGENWNYLIDSNDPLPGQYSGIDAQGQSIALTNVQRDGQHHINYTKLDRAGFYSIHQGGRKLASIAVNLDPRESDLRQILPQQILARLGTRASPKDADAPDPWTVSLTNVGHPLWAECLLLAMLAVAAELSLLTFWRR